MFVVVVVIVVVGEKSVELTLHVAYVYGEKVLRLAMDWFSMVDEIKSQRENELHGLQAGRFRVSRPLGRSWILSRRDLLEVLVYHEVACSDLISDKHTHCKI